MEQNNRINRAFTQQEIEQHLKSALAAATPDVWSKLDLTVPQERPKLDLAVAGKQSDLDRTVPQKKSKLLYLNRRLHGLGMAAAACICLMTVGGGYYHYEYLQVASQVEIDVNPSLKLSLNRKERVLQAEALNADGAELVNISSLKGQTVDQAVDQVVDSLVEKGYLQKGEAKHAVLVSVSGKNEEKAQQLKASVAANVEQTLSEKEVQAVVYDQVIQVTKELEELAEAYQVSVGKAEFVGQLVNENDALNQDQQDAYSRMMGQTMEELTQEIDENAYLVSAKVTIIRTEPVKSREPSADRREQRQLADGKAADHQNLNQAEKGNAYQKEENAVKDPEDQNKAPQDQGSQSGAVKDHGEPDGKAQSGSPEKADSIPDDENSSPADENDSNVPDAPESSENDLKQPEEPLETETILAGSEMPAGDDAAAVLADAGLGTPDKEHEAGTLTGGAVTASALKPLEGAADKEPQLPEENTEAEPEYEVSKPAEGDADSALKPAEGEVDETLEPAEGGADETSGSAEGGADETLEPTEGEADETSGPAEEEADEDSELPEKDNDPEPESGEPADEGMDLDPALQQSDSEQDWMPSYSAEDRPAAADPIHPAGPEAPEPPDGPGELADFEDEAEEGEEISRIIHSPSNRLDTFEPGDMVSRKETGSMITSSGNQIIFEDVEKKEWKEPVYASEFLTGSERRLLQKGPGVFSGNISEEDQETILRFGPGFAAYSERGRESIQAENDIFLSHGFLGLRTRIIKIKK